MRKTIIRKTALQKQTTSITEDATPTMKRFNPSFGGETPISAIIDLVKNTKRQETCYNGGDTIGSR